MIAPGERPRLSLIACTDGRADLDALQERMIRAASRARAVVELVLVDNSRTGGIAALPDVRVVRASLPGLSRARTVGCALARGELLVFVDDDVLFDDGWLDRMLDAFAAGADVVAAPIALAADIEAMSLPPVVRAWLAENLAGPGPVRVVGAGFGFTRAMLQHALWDPALGAGPHGTGYGEEQLFALMCGAAGARIAMAEGPALVHDPDRGRIALDVMMREAVRKGRSEAYISHHWRGESPAWPRLRRLVRGVRARRRARRSSSALDDRAAAALEAAQDAAFIDELIALRGQPRLFADRRS